MCSNCASRFIGRPCITETPMKVIGIAACVYLGAEYYAHPSDFIWLFIDTVIANREPEYFKLYQIEDDSLYFINEVRWDTATPRYQVTFPMMKYDDAAIAAGFMNPDTVFYLYEAFFEKPVTVHDTFVVGGTTWNNIVHGYDTELFENPYEGYNWSEHIPTQYVALRNANGNILCNPNPPYFYIKYLSPYHSVYNDSITYTWILDTTSFFKCEPQGYEAWWVFFAIFDTDFVYNECMGVWTTGLYVEAVDTSGTATLSWDDSGVEQWQVSVAPLGVEADSGMLFASPINYLQVMGLDTGQWYVARVRTLCDTDFFGAWSDSVLFYVPGRSCVTPTGLHVVAVDSAMVSLAWDAGTATTWQVERGMCDLGMSNAQTVTTTTPALTVADLPFTDAWYWARVRVVCDTDFWSDWTDTVRFYVPNQHTGGGPDDTTQAINLVEQYTYLMPNPARDEVTVASSFRVKTVELYAADGKLLQSKEVNAVGTTLSLEGLPAGIYFVRVRTSAGVTTKRLVVE